jgi:hypothetical protein
MSRRSRLWKATMRRRRHYAKLNEPGNPCWGWLIALDDLQDLAAMPFVRCARSWKRTPLRRAR